MTNNVNAQSSIKKKNKLGQKATNTIANTIIYIILSVMSSISYTFYIDKH